MYRLKKNKQGKGDTMKIKLKMVLAAAALATAFAQPVAANDEGQAGPKTPDSPKRDQKIAELLKMMEEIKASSFTNLEMARAGVVGASALINRDGAEQDSCTLLTEAFTLATKSSGLLKKVADLEARLGIITPEKQQNLSVAIDIIVTGINKTGQSGKMACDTRFGA